MLDVPINLSFIFFADHSVKQDFYLHKDLNFFRQIFRPIMLVLVDKPLERKICILFQAIQQKFVITLYFSGFISQLQQAQKVNITNTNTGIDSFPCLSIQWKLSITSHGQGRPVSLALKTAIIIGMQIIVIKGMEILISVDFAGTIIPMTMLENLNQFQSLLTKCII